MADPIRAALERLTGDIQEARDCIEGWGAYASEYFQQKHDLAGDLAAFDRKIAAARAVLAGQQGEGPSDDQLDLVVIAIQALTSHQPDATTHDLYAVDRGREILRNALARWGHQPAPPAEGEVAELVTLLAVGADCSGGAKLSPDQCHRAAELLQQQHPTPVPVSERPWEREGWCDDEGRCWCMSSLDGPPPRWWLVRPEPLSHGFVLPAHALPLPQGEVE